MLRSNQRLIRKTHRYLGIVIGIQFLAWTISGLYFSWSDIDIIHGDHMRKSPGFLSGNESLVSPAEAIRNLKDVSAVDSVHSVRLMALLGKPVYQIAYFSGHAGEVHHHLHYSLADATTGIIRPPLGKDEAAAVARDHVTSGARLGRIHLIQETGGHHEYRGSPLPAWAVTFDDPACTVYVSAELGTFQTIRHDQWRIFDFLWMFHTMDYEGRDDINNTLLRVFSIFGLATVISGFLLFLATVRRS